jgi:hypothetical protein
MATGAKQIELEIEHVLKLIEELKNKKASGRVAAQEMDALSSRLNQLKTTLTTVNGNTRSRYP